jgi:hypothetical protein
MSHYFMKGYACWQKPRVMAIHGCFYKTQRILMSDGSRKTINHVKKGDKVPSRNRKTGQIEAKTVLWAGRNGRSEKWIRIKMQHGDDLMCTPDHPVYLYGCEDALQAQQIHEGQLLEGLRPEFTETQKSLRFVPCGNMVLSAKEWKPREKKSTRFALTIEDNHNYYAGFSLVGNTPEACWQAEKESGSFTASVQGVQDYDAAICMAKRHLHFWREFDHKGILHMVDKGIDLERFTPKGMRIDCDGEPSIGMGEIMRDAVKSPLIPYWAVNEYHRQNHHARLHHWGVDKEREVLEMMIHKAGFDRFLGIRGGIHGRQLFPEQWYRGCKMMISPSMYGEPSRVQFEAQATGCPVVAWGSDPYNDSYANMFADPFDQHDMANCLAKLYDQIRANPLKVRQETRMIAEQHFDMKRMAKQVVEILRKVQEGG